jgi:polar amino acid transport system substrate-binding protein
MTMKIAPRVMAAVLGSALLLPALGACGADSGSGSGSAAKAAGAKSDQLPSVKPDAAAVKLLPASVKKGGTLSMAADLHYPPTSFLAADNKTPVGYNVDIAKLLGQELGLKVQIKNVSFDSVIPGLAAGRYDFTATDMSATPERLKVLDMISYWVDGSSLATAKGNPLKLSLADQSLCGHSIAVMTGTTQQETYLPEISRACQTAGKKAVQKVVLPNVQGALTQLSSKRIDGVFYDTPSLAWAVKQQPQSFELLSPQYKKKSGNDIVALGLPKNSPLTPALHAAMQALMDGPAYKAALDRWGLGSGAISTAQVMK